MCINEDIETYFYLQFIELNNYYFIASVDICIIIVLFKLLIYQIFQRGKGVAL